MGCSVQYQNISWKVGVTRETSFDRCSVDGEKMAKVKVEIDTSRRTSKKSPVEGSKVQQKSSDNGARPKVLTTIPVSKQEKKKEKENTKKRKWKPLNLSECGFNMSLFPRPTRPELIDPEEEAAIIKKIENELEEYDDLVDKYKDLDSENTVLFEGVCKASDKLARPDRHRKVQKAGKQVKHKNCTSIKNNKGRRKLFIHHRLLKLINLDDKRLYLHLPSQHADICVISKNNKNSTETRSKLKPNQPVPARRPPPVQNLRFALQTTNAASHLESSLVNILINLQHRELTPEDYETLLQLDDSIAPKTVDKLLLDNFKTDLVNENTAGDICPVCMDAYEIGENRKFLPCNHVFHAKCIDMWLENSSRNCPIDGLPVDEKS